MKNKFLKELENYLMVLNEEERKDIINEYSDIIDEKVKHGKTVKEAITDFGDVKALSTEILKAYKINPDYDKKDTTKEFVEASENFVKDTAKSLSNWFKRVTKEMNTNMTTETIFEIIIKSIILLAVFLIMRLPFFLIEGMGKGILNIAIYPIDHILGFAWSFIVAILYFAACIFIAIIVFKPYFKNQPTKDSKTEVKKDTTKKEVIKEEVLTKPIVETKEETKKKEVIQQTTTKSNSPIMEAILIIVRIFVVIFILVPAWIVIISLCILLAILVYYLFQGIGLFGLVLIIFGAILIGSQFTEIIYRVTFTKNKLHYGSIIAGFIIFVIGCFLSIDMMFNYSYYNNQPKIEDNAYQEIYNEKTNGKTIVRGDFNTVDYEIDNTLKDDEVVIKVFYFDEYMSLGKMNYINSNQNTIIDIDVKEINTKQFKKVYKQVLKDLKNKELYNYSKIYEPSLIIYTNEKMKHSVRIDS